MYPKTLQQLIESFKMLPGVGQKTAERYALTLLESNIEDLNEFASNLMNIKLNIKTCKVCHNLTETEICDICADNTRDQNTICVVSSAKEVFSIEKTQEYHGVYHVLDGLISTKKGIMPDQLNIESLEKRLSLESKEVILALNATVEGEMTSLYLAKRLEDKVDVTRLAFGLPIGGHLDYADDMTLIKAFEGRNKIK